MEGKSFCYWLQGFFEIGKNNTLTEEQVKMIKDHLALVFFHEIDPSYSDKPEVQQKMNEIHNGSDNIDKPIISQESKPSITHDSILDEFHSYNKPQGPDDQTLYRC